MHLQPKQGFSRAFIAVMGSYQNMKTQLYNTLHRPDLEDLHYDIDSIGLVIRMVRFSFQSTTVIDINELSRTLYAFYYSIGLDKENILDFSYTNVFQAAQIITIVLGRSIKTLKYGPAYSINVSVGRNTINTAGLFGIKIEYVPFLNQRKRRLVFESSILEDDDIISDHKRFSL